MVDDDIRGKAAADGIIRKRGFQIALNRADGQAAAVVEARAEAEHQKLLVPDAVLIADVVLGRIAGVVILLLIGIRSGGACRAGNGRRARAGGGIVLAGGRAGGQQNTAGQQSGEQYSGQFFHLCDPP